MVHTKLTSSTAVVIALLCLLGTGRTSWAGSQEPAGGSPASERTSVCIHSDPVMIPGGQDGTAQWEQMLAGELDRAGFSPAAFGGDPASCGVVLHTSLTWNRKTSWRDRVSAIQKKMPAGVPLPIPGVGGVITRIAAGVATAQGVASLMSGFTEATKPNDTFTLAFDMTRGTARVAGAALPPVKAMEGRLSEVWTGLLSSLMVQVRTHAPVK